MRRRLIFSAFLLYVVAALVAPTVATGQPSRPVASGRIVELKVPAPSLKGNLLGDPVEQPVVIYLPPSYDKDPAKRYPTIYLLHGYMGRPQEWINQGYEGMFLQPEMDTLIANAKTSEMIVVAPNGRNAYLGSFYTNSIVTGNWEDHITCDVVSFIDSRYRTLARSSSRGIAGHSMGGYGAFMLAMKHPDLFGAVFSLSPCCIGFEGDISDDNPAWAKAGKAASRDIFSTEPKSFDDFWVNAMIAVSAAFTPDPQKAPLFVNLPFVEKNGSVIRNEAAYSGYRDRMPLYQVERYRGNLMKLRGIFLDVGEVDEFTHIRRATAKLSAALSDREIPHTFEIYKDGNHGNKIRERFASKVMPFFSATLEK